MIFRDYTLLAGRIHSRRRYDTRDLAPAAVETAAGMLRRLREGTLAAGHGIDALPPFLVRLGLPAPYRDAPGNGLFFTVEEPMQTPFQYNVVLRSDTDEQDALYGLATALAMSSAGQGITWTETEIQEMVQPLYEDRPLLATALLPMTLDQTLVRVAADFSTCFAAALLLEKRE